MLKIGDIFVMTPEVLELIKRRDNIVYECFEDRKGLQGKLYANRLDIDGGNMCIDWEDGKQTNISFLDQTNIKYEKPTFPKISVKDASDSLLHERQIIEKHLLYPNDKISLEERMTRKDVLEKIDRIMDKFKMVFYRP